MALVAVDCSAHETSTKTAPPALLATELHLKLRALRHKGTAGTNSRHTSNQDTNSLATSNKVTNSKDTSSQATARHHLRASNRVTTMRSLLLTSRDTRYRTLSKDTASHRSSSRLKEGTARARVVTVSRDTTEDTGTSMARAVRVEGIKWEESG
jgi:hypothetical protein